MEQKSVLHIVFSPSAAGSLKYVLRRIGYDQRVIWQSDNLSFGPIKDATGEERLKWIEAELGYDGEGETYQSDDLFWAEATSSDVRSVVWMNLRSAREYAGFLEFLWRVPHSDFSVVDTTNIILQAGRATTAIAHSIAEMAPEQIINAQLIDRQTILTAADFEKYKAVWRKLRSENASLRIVTANGLTSAPINYFDDEISSFVRDQWTKCARVIGEVLLKQATGPYLQTGDMLLLSRLRTLAKDGAFEHQGDLSRMRHSEVRRLPQRT